MMEILDIDPQEIEKRKERIRRAWRYQEVDHIPIGLFLDDMSGHTLRDVCENGELQFQLNQRNINRMLRIVPDDYIPSARFWQGYMTIATMFGLKVHWHDNPNQPPGISEHIIHNVKQVYNLRKPDAKTSGLMPSNLKWLKYFTENFPQEVYIAGIDLGGPLNTAKDLFDTDLFYLAMTDAPDEMRFLLDLAVNVQIECLNEIVKAVGSINRMTSIDFDPIWAPEGRKGFVSDDVCASIGPEAFKKFSMPYNSRIFKSWQGGRIHNCGPHPGINLYLDHEPAINGLNCSFRHTRKDLARIKEAFRGRGIVEFMYDFNETADEIISGFEEIARILSPDVVGIPILWLDGSWTDDAIIELYCGVRRIAERYAGEMNWEKE